MALPLIEIVSTSSEENENAINVDSAENDEHTSITSGGSILSQLRPYAELIRLNKPQGAVLLCLPSYAGSALAALLSTRPISPPELLILNLKMTLGGFLMRSLGCTWDDILDHDIDAKVARTRKRPLPQGAVSLRAALVFCLAHLIFGVAVLLLVLPLPCFWYGATSMILVAIYPTCKRWTNYPQAILGIIFSWGIFIAFPALDVPLFVGRNIAPALLLHFAFAGWTVVYDSIYAAQDVKDDLHIGLRSTMTRFSDSARDFLRVVAIAQVLLLLSLAVLLGAGHLFNTIETIAIGLLGYMVEIVKLDEAKDCAWWFGKGSPWIGGLVAMALTIEYGRRVNV